MNDPITLADWWAYIKTDSDAVRVAYFLRNHGAFGRYREPGEILAFLAGKVTVTCHRKYGPDGSAAGCYTIEAGGELFSLRVDPSRPGIHGPRREDSFCLCHRYRIGA